MATLVGGCSRVSELLGGGSSSPPSVGTPAGMEHLSEYYEQELDWVECGPGECAELTVPLNYAEPGGQTIEISVLKSPARQQGNRLGALVLNPGGPGGSGVDYASYASFIVGPEVLERYDIVGFDPRGVARSAPVSCVSEAEMDVQLGFLPLPEGVSDEELVDQFLDGCAANSGAIVGHVSTLDVVQDMDILRANLGDEQLNFLGKSYGSYLGTVYAEQFTDRVGRFVLDGALPPDVTSEEITIGQAEGFERASRAWAQDCVDTAQCPLGSDVDSVMAGLGELIAGLDDDPVPVRGDARISELTSAGAFWGVIQPMYDQGMWALLTDALADVVEDGDGTELQGLANGYAERTPSGAYLGNLLQSNSVINCSDREPGTDPEGTLAAAREAAPLWGELMANLDDGLCDAWPYEIEGGTRTIAAAGSAPIVVIGTTRDPATPYEWSQRLADQLESGVLISFDGDGHTAYMRSNSCVDQAVDDYLVKGTVPEDGLSC